MHFVIYVYSRQNMQFQSILWLLSIIILAGRIHVREYINPMSIHPSFHLSTYYIILCTSNQQEKTFLTRKNVIQSFLANTITYTKQ